MEITNNSIIRYYTECHFDYHWVWGSDRNLFMHYGYFDSEHSSHDKALKNMLKKLVTFGKITKGSKLLDAGCGVGGNAIELVKQYNCQVTAININKEHLYKTAVNAKKAGIGDQIKVVEADFCDTKLPESSFDVVFSLESSCHAFDKNLFIKEAFRLLKPGGRLVIGDGFLFKSPQSQEDKNLMKTWLNGWMVPNLAIVEEFTRDMKNFNFFEIEFQDITSHILPSSKRMRKACFWFYPLAKLFYWFGVRKAIHMANIEAGRAQYFALQKQLWRYGFITGKK